MTSQPHDAPDERTEDVFGDPARSLAVPDPDWSPQSSAPESASAFPPPNPPPQSTYTAAPQSALESGDMRLGAGDIPAMGAEPDSAWTTPPAGFPVAEDATVETQFSHLGLIGVDPWAPVAPWYHAIWPWGWGGVVETLDVLVLALVMFMGVRFMAHNYIVDGASMSPTFEDSDFLIVNRLASRSFDFSWIPGIEADEWRPFGELEPGQVIVFHFQPASSERDFIKRVIAVPGQTVHVTGGFVYVDNVRLDEPYIAQPPNYEFPPTLVEPGTVFVLGDNRNNSYDSHAFGAIDQSTIVGRADFRYWPPARWGLIDHTLGTGEQLTAQVREGMAGLWP